MKADPETGPVHLTSRLVEALKYRPVEDAKSKQRIIFDKGVSGLGLRIGPTNNKSWTFAYFLAGRPKRFTFPGKYPTWDLVKARAEAHKAASLVAEGRDPRRPKPTSTIMLGDFITVYMERYASKKRSGDSVPKVLNRYLPPGWRTRPMNELSHDELARLHQSIGKDHGHYVANNFIRIMRAIFNKAVAWKELPKQHDNPAVGIEFFIEEKRKRFLQPDELVRVFQQLKDEPNIWWKTYFWLSLLLMQRRGELLGARWAEFDFDPANPQWTIPGKRSKNGEDDEVPLVPDAVALLRALANFNTGEFVFPSATSASGHLQEPKKAWNRIRTCAGCPDVRIHDLRRTGGSRAGRNGISPLIIHDILNHKDFDTTLIYTRLGKDTSPQREALEWNARELTKLAKTG